MKAFIFLVFSIFGANICIVQASDISDDRIFASWRLFDEVRGGIFVFTSTHEENGTVTFNGEVLSAGIPSNFNNVLLDFLLTPRMHIGGNLNLNGDISWAYTGLTWTLDLTNWLFLEGTFGGGIHDGKLKPPVQGDQSLLGTRVLFRESVSIGFRISDQLSFLTTAEHLSNAVISDYNHGITAIGGRIGYVF